MKFRVLNDLNKMQKLLLPLLLFIFNLSFGQQKTYTLLSKTQNADVNYPAFKNFDNYNLYKKEGLKKAFLPLKGKMDVYVFISEFEGESFEGGKKKFHDYLILKVDPKSAQIMDGFQYTLEWTDTPTADLYRLSAKNLKLKNNLNLDLLQMKLVYKEEAALNQKLNDKGVLKL